MAYVNCKLLPHEQQYSVIEWECLAIWWAVEMFRYGVVQLLFRVVHLFT